MKKICKKSLALVLSLALVVSLIPFSVFAEGEEDTYTYVSLGASNTNGYGLHGYFDKELYGGVDLYEQPWKTTDDMDISGYQVAPEGSYPDLIRDGLEEQGKNVKLEQLAFSGMRMEEVRMLLDDTYTGDSYTSWRFYGEGSHNWFMKAVNNRIDPDQDMETALATMRGWYQGSIKEADLISFDVGANNFGVYLANRILSNNYKNTNPEDVLTGEALEVFTETKAKIIEKLESYVENEDIDEATSKEIQRIADTCSYALAGFCANFDVAMGKIRELNPDADIVVVSIQNILSGLTAQIGGEDIPLGDIIGSLINMANIYMAVGSPYHNEYYCADLRKNGRVTTFVDEFTNFDGQISSVSQDMKDCFDVYIMKGNAFLKTNIQKTFYNNIIKAVKTDAPDFETAINEASFDDILAGCGDYSTVLKKVYNKALNNAYVAMTKAFQGGVKDNELNIDAYLKYSDLSSDAENYIMAGLGKIAEKAAILGVYEVIKGFEGIEGIDDFSKQCLEQITMCDGSLFDVDEAVKGLYEGDIAKVLTEAEIKAVFTGTDSTSKSIQNLFNYGSDIQSIKLKDGMHELIMAIASLGIRISISNSFCSHPTKEGHIQIKDAIFEALENKITGSQIMAAELEKSEDTLKDYVGDWDDELFDKIVQAIKDDAIESLIGLPEGTKLTNDQLIGLIRAAMSFEEDEDYNALGEALKKAGLISDDITDKIAEINSSYGLTITIGDILEASYTYTTEDDAAFTGKMRPILIAYIESKDLGDILEAALIEAVKGIRTIESFKTVFNDIDEETAAKVIKMLDKYGEILVKVEEAGSLFNSVKESIDDALNNPSSLINPDSCVFEGQKEITLSENGTHYLFAGKTSIGKYEFSKSENGWTIKSIKSGKYLALDDGILKNSEGPYVWSYSNGRFSGVSDKTTYYLAYTKKDNLTVSTGTTRCPGIYDIYNYESHNLIKVEKVDATCSKDGHSEYYVCSRCNKYFSDAEGKNEIEEGSLIIKAHHSWNSKYTVDKEATCTKKGSKSIHCKNCSAKKNVTEIEALGHKYKTVNAGNGCTYKKCTRCGATKSYVSPSYVKSVKVTKSSKAFTVKWKKQSKANQKKFTGYRIKYSTKKDLSGAKTVYVKKSASSKKISKLSKNKKYYVEIRSYVKKNGKTYYSKATNKTVVTK